MDNGWCTHNGSFPHIDKDCTDTRGRDLQEEVRSWSRKEVKSANRLDEFRVDRWPTKAETGAECCQSHSTNKAKPTVQHRGDI